jgi:hypothetical protein
MPLRQSSLTVARAAADAARAVGSETLALAAAVVTLARP